MALVKVLSNIRKVFGTNILLTVSNIHFINNNLFVNLTFSKLIMKVYSTRIMEKLTLGLFIAQYEY